MQKNIKKVRSIDEFIKAVRVKTSQKDDDYKHDFWFRGEGSSNFQTPLVPNSYRYIAENFKDKIDDLFNSDHVKSLEKNISFLFNRKAYPYISSKLIENTPWNRYFLMQHYGISTRLLDWTESALLALFFSASDKSHLIKHDHDMRVWILKPFALNNYTIYKLVKIKGYNHIPRELKTEKATSLLNEDDKLQTRELLRRYLTMNFEKTNEKLCSFAYYPLAIYPTQLDERMLAQKTCFTLFGNRINGLYSAPGKSVFLDQVIIEGGGNRRNILEQLKLLGISYESIYPDLDGLGRSIREIQTKELINDLGLMQHLFDKGKYF